MADIANIKSGERVVEVLHPGTKQPIGVQVSLRSVDDPKMQALRRKITDRRLYLEARGKTFAAVDLEKNGKDIAFTAMEDWSWAKDVTFNGAVPDFTKENVIKVFDELPWFLVFINEQIGETETFFGASGVS